jgi:hypothetical protein
MDVTEAGMDTLVRLLHLKNALSLMDVTEAGMDTLVRLLQSANAPSPMVTTRSFLIVSGMGSRVAEPV